jgi:carotenoid cleavage dioxygenase
MLASTSFARYNTKNPVLNGAWAPVTEERAFDNLEIEGKIPDDLVGTLYRDCYNQRFAPLNPDTYHIFDGDGMVYSIELRDGKASYRDRWVQNDGAKAELAAGRELYNGLYSASGMPQRQLPPGAPRVKDVGSVNVIPLGNRILALQESGDHWWQLDPGTLDVIEPFNFLGETAGRGALTAHPHTDPATGNLIFLQLDSRRDNLDICEAAPSGKLLSRQSVQLPWSGYVHDMMFTHDYYIIMIGPIAWDTNFEDVVNEGRSSWTFHPERGSQILLINRKDGSVRTVTDEPNQVNHYLNAYQDGDQVIIDASVDPIGSGGTKDLVVSDQFPVWREGNTIKKPALWRWTVDMKQGTVTHEHVGGLSVDMPRPNETLMGSKHRYGYFMNAAFASGGATGAIGNTALKHDYLTGVTREQIGGKEGGFNVGEPVFVPRAGAASEDDGYVLVVFRHFATLSSQLLILDAQNFDGEPLARVKINAWLPASVHGNWVPSDS